MRLLLFVTSHLSLFHMKMLETCWPLMMRDQTLRRAHVHAFLTSHKVPPLQHLPNNVTITHANNPGYQQGAKLAMHDPTQHLIMRRFDWVIRLNPDVIIYSMALLKEVMSDPSVDAIFANCGQSWGTVDPLCKKGCLGRKTMSDFFAFRPKALNLSQDPLHDVRADAEDDAERFFRRIVMKGRERWLSSSHRTGWCRIKNTDVRHEHSMRRCRVAANYKGQM